MAKSKLVEVNGKIAEGVVGGYKKMEEGVIVGYKKIEEGAVGGFHKIADKFVDPFLMKEGESVEEAKERLSAYGAHTGMGCVPAGSYCGSDWGCHPADYGNGMAQDGK